MGLEPGESIKTVNFEEWYAENRKPGWDYLAGKAALAAWEACYHQGSLPKQTPRTPAGSKDLLPALQKYATEGSSLRKFADECNALDLETELKTLKQVVLRAPNGHPIFVITTEQGLKSFAHYLKNKVGESK